MLNQCIKTSLGNFILKYLLELLIALTSSFLPIHPMKWENYRLILLKDQSLSVPEKNVGPSPSQDSPDFILLNSKLVTINFNPNSGETTSLMPEEKNGAPKTPMVKENP